MRIPSKLATIAAALAMLASQPASAEEAAIPANRETAVNFITGVTANCRNIAKPKMKVVKAPAYGTVRFQWTKYKISNISRLCDGKPALGMMIFFKPQPGYRGKDSFTFGASMQRYEGSSDTQYKQHKLDVVVK
ncbi:hypothetical protein [Pararhizobium sp. PWRC1-1]|uniref:hypothetical protein n=1 Tax=Pararhizobium sp. PWRC1-1 TaxID=2804566 RepID=UPI003CFBB612